MPKIRKNSSNGLISILSSSLRYSLLLSSSAYTCIPISIYQYMSVCHLSTIKTCFDLLKYEGYLPTVQSSKHSTPHHKLIWCICVSFIQQFLCGVLSLNHFLQSFRKNHDIDFSTQVYSCLSPYLEDYLFLIFCENKNVYIKKSEC